MSSEDILARREKDAKMKREKRAQNNEPNCNEVHENSIPIEEEDIEENTNVDMNEDDAPLNEVSNSMTMDMNASMSLNLCILL